MKHLSIEKQFKKKYRIVKTDLQKEHFDVPKMADTVFWPTMCLTLLALEDLKRAVDV